MKKPIILLMALLIAGGFSSAQEGSATGRNSLKLHIDSIVADGHNDTILRIIDEESWLPRDDIRKGTSFHADLSKLRAGNISVPFFAAYSSPFYGQPERSLSRTLAIFNALYWTERNNPDILEIVSSYDQIEKALLGRRIAAVPTIEGAYSITENNWEDLLLQYRDLGVKAIGFTWNYSNDLAEGLYKAYGDYKGTPSQVGLTDLGIQTLERMNQLGIIADVSHLSEESFWDVINNTKSPVIASHSGAYEAYPHPRNLKDDQIEAIGDNGGVIGVVYHDEFVGGHGKTCVKDIVDHMEHIIDLVGVDHVGMGSDFDGAYLPVDLEDASKVYRITEELARRGYSDREIKKILGLNLLRVIKDNDAIAEKGTISEEVSIAPDFTMGEVFHDSRPVFSTDISGSHEDMEIYGVVDGIRYPLEKDNGKNVFTPELDLKERFHVVTFVAEHPTRGEQRETRIIYIEQN
jgi:membrane dipeptidase